MANASNLSFHAYLESLLFHAAAPRPARAPGQGRQPFRWPDRTGVIQNLMDAIRLLVRKAAIQGASREDLLVALTTTLSNYTHLRNSPAAVAVLLFIRRTCLRDCGYQVDDPELRRLWE